MSRETKDEVAADTWRKIIECAMAHIKTTAGSLSALGLTPGHMKVLFLLDPDQARPMGALAAQIPCDASSMTWLIDRLEEQGMVQRRSLPDDRRVKAVAMTAKGRTLRKRLEAKMFKPPADLLSLDRATLDTIRALFEKVTANQADARTGIQASSRSTRTAV